MCADIRDGRGQLLPSKGRIQMSKTNYLQAVISDLQRTAGPYRCATSSHAPFRPVAPLCSLELGDDAVPSSRVIAAIAALAAAITPAPAQDWPTRPVTMILPFAAGGPLDGIGRILAARLSDVLGQQVVIENVTGAGGTIGSNRVAKAAPDGYQFLLGHVGTHAFSQTLYKKPPYDAVTEFAPVSLVYHGLFLLLARKDLPVSTLAEFTAYAKANQDTMQFGSAGAGSISHMACVLLNLSMGTKTTHVPYRGNAPAMQDLIAGRLDFMCDSIVTALPQI